MSEGDRMMRGHATTLGIYTHVVDASHRAAVTAVEPVVPPLEDAWPLFRLRIRSENLVLRLPTDDDLPGMLDLARAGIHPPDEMPFGIAWTDAKGASFDRSFLQHHWSWRGRWPCPRDGRERGAGLRRHGCH